MNEREFQELSAGYALGALAPADRRAVEAAVAEHPEWEVHLRADVDTAALLADAAPPVPPPANVRAELLARIATTPQHGDALDPTATGIRDAPTPDLRARQPRRARRGWFVLAASLVLVAALGVGAVVVAQEALRPAAVVALEEIQNSSDVQSATFDDGGVAATAYWSAETGQAVLVSDGLPAISDQETYELWFVRDGAPVSAGTFGASAGETTALLSGEVETGDVIAVTVEPAGGSPTGAPTTDPIVAIET